MTENLGPEASGRNDDDGPRKRILGTAYDLFARHGVEAIGVSQIVAEAAVARMTLYRHFQSKDELVVATLELRRELWTKNWLQHEIDRLGGPARDRLMTIFDLLDDWFSRDDYSGCMFANHMLESHDSKGMIGAACARGLTEVRAFIEGLAEEAGAADPADLARQWQVLMWGSIVLASSGDIASARRVRRTAAALLANAIPTA
jgi:AcrR family transcriptional regulator